jgi:crossover junction endodeoxyribonuclease RuvC
VRVLGIDPGVHGGLAIVAINDGVTPALVDAIDVPTIGTGAKERIDVLALRKWIEMHRPQHALIERAGSMPKQGAASTFKYGRAVGALEAVIVCCGISMSIIDPATWKKFHRLPGKDKERARQRALEIFPGAHAVLARKKDHQRAEAMLLAITPVPGVILPKTAPITTTEFAEVTA